MRSEYIKALKEIYEQHKVLFDTLEATGFSDQQIYKLITNDKNNLSVFEYLLKINPLSPSRDTRLQTLLDNEVTIDYIVACMSNSLKPIFKLCHILQTGDMANLVRHNISKDRIIKILSFRHGDLHLDDLIKLCKNEGFHPILQKYDIKEKILNVCSDNRGFSVLKAFQKLLSRVSSDNALTNLEALEQIGFEGNAIMTILFQPCGSNKINLFLDNIKNSALTQFITMHPEYIVDIMLLSDKKLQFMFNILKQPACRLSLEDHNNFQKLCSRIELSKNKDLATIPQTLSALEAFTNAALTSEKHPLDDAEEKPPKHKKRTRTSKPIAGPAESPPNAPNIQLLPTLGLFKLERRESSVAEKQLLEHQQCFIEAITAQFFIQNQARVRSDSFKRIALLNIEISERALDLPRCIAWLTRLNKVNSFIEQTSIQIELLPIILDKLYAMQSAELNAYVNKYLVTLHEQSINENIEPGIYDNFIACYRKFLASLNKLTAEHQEEDERFRADGPSLLEETEKTTLGIPK